MFIFKDFTHTSFLEYMFAVQNTIGWQFLIASLDFFIFAKKCTVNLMGVIYSNFYPLSFRIHSVFDPECLCSICFRCSIYSIQFYLAILGDIWILLYIFPLIFGNVSLNISYISLITSILLISWTIFMLSLLWIISKYPQVQYLSYLCFLLDLVSSSSPMFLFGYFHNLSFIHF